MIANGVQPTVVGYTSAVSALAHCGEVDQALELLREMKEDAGIEPNEQVCWFLLSFALVKRQMVEYTAYRARPYVS